MDVIPPSLIEVLRRTSRGEGSDDELAGALERLRELVVIVSPGDVDRFLDDAHAAAESGGAARAGELAMPREVGITTPDGRFAPLVFTDDETAREYAVASELIAPDGAMSFRTKAPADGLYECLVRGYPGIVVNDGTDHRVDLSRNTVSRLYALMARREFAHLPTLHAVVRDGAIHLQRPEDGRGGLWAFAYDREASAAEGLPRLEAAGAGATVASTDTPGFLRSLLAAGVTRLVVDPMLATERLYDRDDLVHMLRLRGGRSGARTARPGAAPARRTARPAAAPRAPGRPAFPPPGRPAAAATAAFHAWRRRREGGSLPVWEDVEALAFDLDLWVPIYDEEVDGRPWPALWAHSEAGERHVVYTFADRGLAERALPGLRFQHLSGIEAMRWAWSAPRNVDEIAVNLHEGSDGWAVLPSHWALAAIFPQSHPMPTLDAVARVELARIGDLPGARGLKPEVVRALLTDWRALSAVVDPASDGLRPVEHQGRRYLPAFTDPTQHLRFAAVHRGYGGRLAAVVDEPPFGRWLLAARDYDGVLLDPCGRRPLPLEAGDLLFLDRWTALAGEQPLGAHLVRETGRLRDRGAVTARLAGRLVADWPRYYVAIERTPAGAARMLKLPAGDCCALFTSLATARAFIDGIRSLGLAGGDTQPVPIPSRWRYSAFHAVAEQFEEAWIDPSPTEGGGLALDRDALAGALERLDEQLRPRLPGFAADRPE